MSEEERKNKIQEELNELNLKKYKLEEFLYKSEDYRKLPIEQQYLLQIQFDTMRTYSDILQLRINAINNKVKED